MVFQRSQKGLCLIEVLMVVGLISLMAAVATISYSAMFGSVRFKQEVRELVNVLQTAQDAAAQSDRRYEVIIDRDALGFDEEKQGYMLREFIGYTYLEDEQPLNNYSEVEAIQKSYFSKAVYIESVEFDYYTKQEEEELKTGSDRFFRFVTGRSGWQAGGKIVLLDEHERPWTIVIHRLAKPVELIEGDELIWLPQDEQNVPF